MIRCERSGDNSLNARFEITARNMDRAREDAGSQLFCFTAVDYDDSLTEQLYNFGRVNLFDLPLDVAQKFAT